MNKQKKLQRDVSTNITFLKIFGRARAQSHIAVKTQKIMFFCSLGRIFYRCARGSARTPNFFWKCDIHDKISFQFFRLAITQKVNFVEQFEV